MSIGSWLRAWWQGSSRVPDLPVAVHSMEDAARLANNWPGVRKAAFQRIVFETKSRQIVAVQFWPWTPASRRRAMVLTITSEINRRSVAPMHPCFTQWKTAERMQAAVNEQLEREKIKDA